MTTSNPTSQASEALQKARELHAKIDWQSKGQWGHFEDREKWERAVVDAFPSIHAELERLTEAYGKMREALAAIQFGAGEQTLDEADYEEYEIYFEALERCRDIAQEVLS